MNEKKAQVVALIVTILIIGGIGVLCFYAVWLAALLFVALSIYIAAQAGRRRRHARGVWEFVKAMMLGW